MKIIKDYIEVLFLQVPITDKTKQIKEDLLGTAEDHYYGLIEEGVSEKEAIGIVISDFGTIDEILKELDLEKEVVEEIDYDQTDVLSIDDAFDYWREVRRLSMGISVGLFFFVGAFSFIPIMNGAYGGFIGVMGLLLMFLFWALGVLFFVINGYSLRKNIRRLKRSIISQRVRDEAFEQAESYRKSYLAGISAGVIAYALSFPLGIFSYEYIFYNEIGISFFLGVCAMGTLLIAYVSIIQREYRRLVKMSVKVQKKRLERNNKRSILHHEETFWIIVTAFYFIFSFLFESWLFSWLIFLVGYVIQSILKNKENQQEYN